MEKPLVLLEDEIARRVIKESKCGKRVISDI